MIIGKPPDVKLETHIWLEKGYKEGTVHLRMATCPEDTATIALVREGVHVIEFCRDQLADFGFDIREGQ